MIARSQLDSSCSCLLNEIRYHLASNVVIWSLLQICRPHSSARATAGTMRVYLRFHVKHHSAVTDATHCTQTSFSHEDHSFALIASSQVPSSQSVNCRTLRGQAYHNTTVVVMSNHGSCTTCIIPSVGRPAMCTNVVRHYGLNNMQCRQDPEVPRMKQLT